MLAAYENCSSTLKIITGEAGGALVLIPVQDREEQEKIKVLSVADPEEEGSRKLPNLIRGAYA